MPHHEWDDARTAFEEASAFFVRTVRAITDGWDDHALGVWTLRDLVGHTSRALLTVEAYLAKPADVVTVSSPTDYFIEIMRAAGDPVAVAQRGRDAGAALGDEPATEVAVIADRVVDVVRRADGLQLLTCPVGGITLLDYLPTRTFELTVHTCDVEAARGTTADVPPSAALASLSLIAGLAARGPRAASLLRAATGRGGLTDGFTVLS